MLAQHRRVAAVLKTGNRCGIHDRPFPPCLRMAGTKWRIPWMTPQTLTPITSSQSSSGMPINLVPCIGTPRLFAGDVKLSKIAFGFGESSEHGPFLRDIDLHRQHT